MRKVRRKAPGSKPAPRADMITALDALASRCETHMRQLHGHSTYRTLAALFRALARGLESTHNELAWLLLARTAVTSIADASASERLSPSPSLRRGKP
jgi:hypothetical protein